MKKIIIIYIIILSGFTLKAQESKIIGSWLATKVDIAGEIQNPYVIKEYTKEGKMVMMGMEIGTWSYNKTTNEIEMLSDFDKDFNGNDKILTLTDKELIADKDGTKVTYLKLDFEQISKENKTSKLVGEWNLKNDLGETQLLKIELPDTFYFTNAAVGHTTKSKGTWAYNSKEKTVLFIGRSSLLKGISTIKELSENKFVLEKNGIEIIANKQALTTPPIERLSFEYEDFPEEQIENSPWQDFEALLNGLKTVKYLKYKQSKLIPNTTAFKYNTLLSKINVNSEDKRISLANLSISKKDTMQYSESVKGDLMNSYNNFFPQEEPSPFRLVTTETITVPAGEFNCKVFEGFDGETKIKYWMIIDKPGVYAKIIREGLNPFEELEYSIIELEEIK